MTYLEIARKKMDNLFLKKEEQKPSEIEAIVRLLLQHLEQKEKEE